MRVLTVARWWPSHDAPGRGSFVRDLVQATVDAGVDARVVSFDRLIIKGRDPEHCQQLKAAALAAYEPIASPEKLFVLPRSFGAAGVPVARLPILQVHGVRHADAWLGDHAEVLAPFVRALVRQWRPDVIHAHTGVPDGIVAAAVAREHAIPIVVTEHASTLETELADPVAAEAYRTLLAPDVMLTAVSPPLVARLAAVLGLEPGHIGYLPNPVSVNEFLNVTGTRREADSVLYVGSLGDHKHVDVLLRAIAELRISRPGLHLRLVGGDLKPGDRGRLEELVRALEIEDAVSFQGWLDREKVAAAMSQAAVFAHPSPSETFGVVAVEAILAGLPVATRRSGGVPWIVQRSGGFGAVADSDSPTTFAHAIDSVLRGPLAVDAATARSRLADEFGAEAVAQRLLEVYGKLVGSAASSPAARPTAVEPATRSPRTPPRVLVARSRGLARSHVRAVPKDLRAQLVLVVPPQVSGAKPDDLRDLGFRLVEAERPRPRAKGTLARLGRKWPVRDRVLPQNATDLLGQAVLSAAAAVRLDVEVVEVVAVDAAAAVLVAALDPSQVRLAAGALRWLVDSWDAAEATSSP